jgi:serine/threonine protein kinase
VHERLGAGGMATVHVATIELEGGAQREVALKRMLPQLADDRRFVEDFVREAKLAARLNHPNIVQILELGRIGKTYFIAMELVRGHPLMALMRKAFMAKRPVPIGVVLSLGIELCDALDYAHGEATGEDGTPMRVVHRDLSPSNLLVTSDGHLKIIDFGVAKALAGGQFMTNTGLVKGKLGYMSSEALSGKVVDGRADLFSVGVVLWEMLAGKRLFKEKNEYDVISKIRAGAVARPSSINKDCPWELDDIVLRALAREADARWPSAAVMKKALDNVRRYYAKTTSPREVAKWKRALRAESTLSKVRGESDGESTATRLSSSDLVELLEDVPGELGEGSNIERPFAEEPSSAAYAEVSISAGPSVSIREPAVPFEPSDYEEPSGRSPDTLREGDS